jgi:hypothetical protein
VVNGVVGCGAGGVGTQLAPVAPTPPTVALLPSAPVLSPVLTPPAEELSPPGLSLGGQGIDCAPAEPARHTTTMAIRLMPPAKCIRRSIGPVTIG